MLHFTERFRLGSKSCDVSPRYSKCSTRHGHPDPNCAVALYRDASQAFWAAVCTSINEEDSSRLLGQQNRRPLAFLSGKFTRAQLRWPTIEKEALAIVEATKCLEYLLLHPLDSTSLRTTGTLFTCLVPLL
ncbi:hypothetical protein PHMEG_00025787 [Phytophthora megakarya]|uniref:Reverse transcriptase RNase H-like domain-containing protein n=1 Tax=Phytophthora megakarya TaxID=4795 RepID=A0A225VC14_9STRA|nr:hypothetical protein PHMEG_00025787 [Phytophthora megakarya]